MELPTASFTLGVIAHPKLAQKFGQLQPFMAVFPQECMGQLASLGPTRHLSRPQVKPDGTLAMQAGSQCIFPNGAVITPDGKTYIVAESCARGAPVCGRGGFGNTDDSDSLIDDLAGET